jgi:multiple sugar transport system permease protein
VTRTLKVGATTALLTVAAVVTLFPLYWLVMSSLKTGGGLYTQSPLLPPTKVNLGANYDTLISYGSGVFWTWVRNSLIYAGGTAVIGTYLCGLTGYALAKLQFPGRRAVFGAVLGGLMIPSTVLIIPVFIMERQLHLADTFQGVILPLLVFPFGVYFIWSYAASGVPESILDSGRVDGAGEWRIFNSMAVPILVPALVTLFLIMFVGTWNNYFLPLVLLHNPSRIPLPVGLSELLNVGQQQLGVSAYPAVLLGSLISILPMLLLFPFLQRYVSRGLTFGAVAGE